MENVTVVVGEHDFVLDPVLASLPGSISEATPQESAIVVTNFHGRAKCILAGSEIGHADRNVGPRTSPLSQSLPAPRPR
jgi:hypothetical protein